MNNSNKNKNTYRKIGRVLLLTFIGWKLGLGTVTLKFAFGAESAPAFRTQSEASEAGYWAQHSFQRDNLAQKLHQLQKGERYE